MREALAALALIAATPATAAQTAATTAAPPAIAMAPAFTSRLDQLVALLAGKGGYDDLFAPVFRQAVPQAQLDPVLAQLRAQGGAPTGIDSVTPDTAWQATIGVAYNTSVATMIVAVDPAAPHQITGLRITGVTPRHDTLTAVLTTLGQLHGDAGLGLYRLDPDGPVAIVERQGDRPAPIGSAFKLWVLAQTAREVAAGQRHWRDVLTLGPPSLPSGVMQAWPAQAPVTLQTLATEMISISDNTATDTLMTALGRDAIADMVRTIGVATPDRTLPLLTTREAFLLKAPANAAWAQSWATASPAARAALLDRHATDLAAPIDPHLFDGAPLAIDSVEWFASPHDMARTLDWLRRVDDPAVRAILAVNPGMPPTLATRFAYAGFKGGSEPGVLALNYLLRTKSGEWYALAANWHDPARAVSEFDFASLVNRALALIPQ